MRTILSFALLALLLPAPGRADLTGSIVELEQPAGGEVPIGEITVFRFNVTNNSPDYNSIANVIFTFPPCAEVLSGSWDDSAAGNEWIFLFNGVGTNVAAFLDGDDLFTGEINGADVYGVGEHGWFDVIVDMGVDCPHQMDAIDWLLDGDAFGSAPHTLAGSIPIHVYDTPVAGTSWSRVKALY